MENIPLEIEQKLENLPVIPFDMSEDFQKILFSDNYSDIFNFYKTNYLPDVLKAKPEIYQRVSLYLTLTNQAENFTEQTDQVLYRRPVPSIDDFLTNKFFMGYSNATLYDFWKIQLNQIFKEGSPIRKVIFSGCIGSGKSTVARKAFVYALYRILCLRYPRSVFNIDQDATIANVVISMTLKQVYETNILPFVKLMESMPCFQRVMSQRSFENFDLTNPNCPVPFVCEKSTGNIYFPDNIIITCGSNQGHFTGYNVVNSFCDEINEKGVEEAISLLNTLDNRFSSRFQGSDLVFQSVVSSARTTNSAMGEYIRHLPMDDPSILMLKPMLWEVKPDPNFIGDGSTFPVMVGNGSIPSKIITDPGELKAIENGNYNPPTGCELIQVPTVYKSKFELQLDQSIQDIAGMTTSDNNAVFRDTTRLEDPNLNPEIYLEADIRDNVEIIDMIPLEMYFEKGLDGNFYPKRNKKGNFYCHVDLAAGGEGNCDAALCILHKEWKMNEITHQKETVFIVDLMLSINAKNKIDINAIQRFLVTLASDYNMFIHTISSDQWNGVIFQQSLESSGFFKKVANVSVDKKLEPYMNAARLIEMGLVKVGTCNKLKKELEALVLSKGKVTRTTEKKDMADVLVGSIYNAQLNYFDEPLTQYTTEKQVKTKTQIKDLIDTSRQKLVKL